MSSYAIIRMERAIVSLLGSFMIGARSTGNAIVRATGADATIPANTYGIPIVTSAAGAKGPDRSRMVKTVDDAIATQGGVVVPIVSVVGGADQRLDANTPILWDGPAPPGIEARSALDANPLAGGTDMAWPALKRAVVFERVGKADMSKALFTAGAGAFPCAVVSWEGSDDHYKIGRGRQPEDHSFRVYLVVSRLDSEAERAEEGKLLLQMVKELLVDRAAVDGESVSNPPISLGRSGRLPTSDSAFVYWVEFLVHYSNLKRELRTFADWTKTELFEQTAPQDEPPTPPNAPDPLPEVDDLFNM